MKYQSLGENGGGQDDEKPGDLLDLDVKTASVLILGNLSAPPNDMEFSGERSESAATTG